MKKIVFLAGALIFALIVYKIYFLDNKSKPQVNLPRSVNENKNAVQTEIFAEDLEVPWAMAFLPNGEMLVTERPGRVRFIDKNGNLDKNPVLEIEVVKKIQGEGGLHGIAIHPDFVKNRFVYLYYTYENQGENSLNRVARYTFKENSLSLDKIIVDKIPGALFHDGGRIKFGPDKFLYITTGDAQNPSLSQNKNSLAGKILRVTEEGQPAPGNPFNTLIYSYGHRNPQGITWDEKNNLWETEHGQSATDELNLIEQGKNYGWPTIRGSETGNGLTSPIVQSSEDTWAPGGAAYLNGSVYFTGLRGQALYQAIIFGNSADIKIHLKGKFGRIRDVVLGPDNMLYITTSNRDGRGIPKTGDDKILKVNPAKL